MAANEHVRDWSIAMQRAVPQSATTRIVVVGAGVAGVEAAVTLARTVPRAQVLLVGEWPTLRVVPELVYVPLGGTAQGTEVRLNRALARDGIDLRISTVERVDLERRQLICPDGEIPFDVAVFATGTVPSTASGHGLRTLEDALRLREELARVGTGGEDGRSIVLRVPASCTWAPPAFELALLLARWRDAAAERSEIDISIVIENSEPFDLFGTAAAGVVREHLDAARVALVTNVPAHRIDLSPASVVIDFEALVARRIPGLPAVGAGGFYRTDGDGRVAPDVFVVGDATDVPLKSGFAVGWHARRVASAIGGDVASLGPQVDGIPIGASEYQMDLGHQTMCVRFELEQQLGLQYLAAADSVRVVDGRPDKLIGTIVHGLVASERPSAA